MHRTQLCAVHTAEARRPRWSRRALCIVIAVAGTSRVRRGGDIDAFSSSSSSRTNAFSDIVERGIAALFDSQSALFYSQDVFGNPDIYREKDDVVHDRQVAEEQNKNDIKAIDLLIGMEAGVQQCAPLLALVAINCKGTITNALSADRDRLAS
jgi:hypothetical protein